MDISKYLVSEAQSSVFKELTGKMAIFRVMDHELRVYKDGKKLFQVITGSKVKSVPEAVFKKHVDGLLVMRAYNKTKDKSDFWTKQGTVLA